MLSCRASAKKKKKGDFFWFVFKGVFRGNMQNRFLGWVGHCIRSLLDPNWSTGFAKWLLERAALWNGKTVITVWTVDWLWLIEGNLLHREAGKVASHLLLSKWIHIYYSLNKREGCELLEAHGWWVLMQHGVVPKDWVWLNYWTLVAQEGRKQNARHSLCWSKTLSLQCLSRHPQEVPPGLWWRAFLHSSIIKKKGRSSMT